MRRLSLFAPIAIAIACGGKTQMGGVVTLGAEEGGLDAAGVDASVPSGAVARDGCSPVDAPAFEILVADGFVCGSTMTLPSSISILVWPPPKGPGTIAIAPASSLVNRCANGKCTTATSGTLTLTTFSPTGTTAIGSYSLGFPDGTTASGSFTAPLCHNGFMCG